MVQNNSDSSSHQLLDDEARSLAELLLGRPSNSDVVLDLTGGEIDLATLEDSFQQSEIIEALRQEQATSANDSPTEHSAAELKVIISRSVFGRPEPVSPVIRPVAPSAARGSAVMATTVTSEAKPETQTSPAVPTKVSPGPFFPSVARESQKSSITVEEKKRSSQAEAAPRSRRAIPALATGAQRRSQVFRLLIAVFAIGLIGAAASTAFLRFTSDTNDDPGSPVVATSTPETTVVATTQVPSTQVPSTPVKTTIPTTASSEVPVETQLTVPNVSGSRPSWAPDPEQ